MNISPRIKRIPLLSIVFNDDSRFQQVIRGDDEESCGQLARGVLKEEKRFSWNHFGSVRTLKRLHTHLPSVQLYCAPLPLTLEVELDSGPSLAMLVDIIEVSETIEIALYKVTTCTCK